MWFRKSKLVVVEEKIDRALALLKFIARKEVCMSALGQELLDKVTALESVEDGVLALLDSISAELAVAKDSGDIILIQNAINMIDAMKVKAAAAVVANTPAEPAPESTPES